MTLGGGGLSKDRNTYTKQLWKRHWVLLLSSLVVVVSVSMNEDTQDWLTNICHVEDNHFRLVRTMIVLSLNPDTKSSIGKMFTIYNSTWICQTGHKCEPVQQDKTRQQHKKGETKPEFYFENDQIIVINNISRLVVVTRWLLAPSADCSWWGSEGRALDPKHNRYLQRRFPLCMANCTQYAMEEQEGLKKERVRVSN